MKASIIYWSSTGNTEKMAKLIEKALVDSEIDVSLKQVSQANGEDIRASDIILLGCSAMGIEQIDPSEMEPFIKENGECFKDKSVALFGSFGWGDGEWMEDWEVMMRKLGANLKQDSLIVNEAPEGKSEEACTNFGKGIL